MRATGAGRNAYRPDYGGHMPGLNPTRSPVVSWLPLPVPQCTNAQPIVGFAEGCQP